ncbi:MAG: aminopeptidase P family protein [Acidobacteria bacterium]|nr:aminopeptidase P family protein [Acidobacteriota bacterium]
MLTPDDLREAGVDALLVTALPNVRYLSGFTGSNGMLLVTPEGTTLFTDPRYTIQAEAETGARVVIAKGPLEPTVWKHCRRFRKIGFENTRISYPVYQSFEKELKLGASLEPFGDRIERRRMVKTPAEIKAIRESVQINSQAFAAALTRFRAGITEADFAAEIEYQMRLLGADKPSFDTIVAFRENSARPHARPGRAKIDGNGLLLTDMGTFRGGYASDMTRCVHLGTPKPQTRKLYRAVLEAQTSALDKIRPGVTAGQVDRAARQALRNHGLEKAFVHSTGHGLGLEIHEAPRLGRKDATRLVPGMAVTVEPGAYLEGTGGVRIEDTVLVTPTGVEILTPTSKSLIVI